MKISLMFSLLSLFLVLLHPSTAQNSPQDYVNAHNNARAQDGVGPVVWDNNVAAFARSYANKRARDCAMIHSDTNYGENIAAGSGSFSGVDAVNMWFDEWRNYDYNSNSCFNGECRHYTQVVWRNTKRIGCARVQCNSFAWFITCNYDPPGNWEGEWPFGSKDLVAKE